MDLKAYLAERSAMVDEALDALLPPVNVEPSRLHEAIRYSVMAPGKRLRPVLVLSAAEAVNGDPRCVIPTACALECIHAFSLIHDDLPCMDDDDYRRGRLTNHKVFGEAVALLAGDALLALAFELISDNAAQTAPERLVQVVKLVANASGTWGMVGGQVVDMESSGKEVRPETLNYIHSHKTGALIRASVIAGALLVGADQAALTSLERYGVHVGLAFQIADDILDVVGDEQKLGKPVGSDAKLDKATYPKLFGIEASARRARDEAELAIASVSSLGEAAEPLRQIALYVVERDL